MNDNFGIITRMEKIHWNVIEPGLIHDIPKVFQELLFNKASDLRVPYVNLVNACANNLELNLCSYYIIPFVIEGITLAENHIREILLEFLYELLLGSAPFEQTIKYSTLHNKELSFEMTEPYEIPLQVACRSQIASGILTYLDIFNTSSLNSKRFILYILNEFPEYDSEFRFKLKKIFREEINEEIKSLVKEMLGLVQSIR